MEFFDRKEEVLDIQLTPYGKYLLSAGKWKPKSYAFFDNDVIYDIAYTSGSVSSEITELQKDSSERIKTALRVKSQPIVYGLESSFNQLTKEYNQPESKKDWTPPFDPTLPSFPLPPFDKNTNKYDLPLGNSSLNSSFAPSFNVDFYAGTIDSAENHYTGSISTGNGLPVRIPQINSTVKFKTFIEQEEPPGNGTINVSADNDFDIEEQFMESDPPDERKYSPTTYKDGTYVSIQVKRILLDFLENHAPISKENFDLEVFMVDTVTVGEGDKSYEKEQFTPLKFVRDDPFGEIVNSEGIIYNKKTNNYYEITSDYVEYYFDIRVDDEIEPPQLPETTPINQPVNPEEPCIDG